MTMFRPQRKHARTVLISLTLLGVLAVCYGLLMRQFYQVRMPEKLELGWRFWHAGDDFGCGGIAAFSVDERTVESIRRERLAFFSDVRSDTGLNHYYGREGWHETPAHLSPYWGGGPIGLSCVRSFDPHLHNAVIDALNRPGSFYSGDLATMTIVIPSEHLVILSYFD